jgi:hypothetical protein
MCRRTCNLARAIRPWHALAAVIAVGLSILCLGQDETVVHDPYSTDPVVPEPAQPPRLLLLFDGRVIIGDISEVPGGYSVRRTEGQIVVPYDFVRLTATSLRDAYQKQRDNLQNLQNPNAEQHLSLARWCFQYQLREEAVAELEAALKLEPFRKEARELLQLIDAADEQQGPSARESGDRSSAVRPLPRSAGGISSANQLDFVQRVQPLLVNKCGNASCHGSASTNGLHLHNVRTGRSHQRLYSDENLAMALKFVNADFPVDSPLLRKPQDPESVIHQGVFAGALGEQQVEMLRKWIQAVAVDRQLALANGPVEMTAEPEPAPIIEPAELTEEPGPVRPQPRIIEIPRASRDPRSPRSSEVLRNVLDEERPDAFDPEEFNRRLHGGR